VSQIAPNSVVRGTCVTNVHHKPVPVSRTRPHQPLRLTSLGLASPAPAPMDALLRTLPPGNNALAALLQRNDTNTGALVGLPTPARSHALLATPGVGAAAIAAAATATAATVAGVASPWTLHDGVWVKITTFLTMTTRHCTCADEALSGALLRHLPNLYAPGAEATGAANPLYCP